MARVYGFHELALRPGVSEEAFEQFVREKLMPLATYPGWSARLLKGDRGERAGQYAILIEIDSTETRDRYFPGSGPSADAQAFRAQQSATWQAVWQEFASYCTAQLGVDTLYTDYIELAASHP